MRSPLTTTLLSILALSAAACSQAQGAGSASKSTRGADAAHPAVVELFTSQGCSSCPPANAVLAALSTRPDVLALSFGVTYWDDLGWKDTFARRDYTDRQTAYEKGLGRDGDYTPQIVVNGAADVVGSARNEVEAAIAREGAPVGPDITTTAGSAEIGAAPWSGAPADVWLIRYDPKVVQVPVRRGENGGKTLPHKNVVRDLVRLGQWSGRPLKLALAPAAGGLDTAILVQKHGGRIVAAAKIPAIG
jgi:hypothetical protein